MREQRVREFVLVVMRRNENTLTYMRHKLPTDSPVVINYDASNDTWTEGSSSRTYKMGTFQCFEPNAWCGVISIDDPGHMISVVGKYTSLMHDLMQGKPLMKPENFVSPANAHCPTPLN